MNTKVSTYLSILAIMAILLLPGIAQAASPSPFIGHWQAIDVDGSDIRLTIAGPPQGPFQITWTESYFGYCNGEAGIARGKGWLEESNVLTADLTLVCFTTNDSIDFQVTWFYDPGTDTITSQFITWHRPSSRSKACVSPPIGVSGWWPGDGDASDLVAGRDGLFQGDATTGSGLVDLSFWLDGEGDFIEIPNSPGLNFGLGNFTIDLWINFSDTLGEQVLVEKWVQGDGYVDGWTLTKLEGQVLRLAIDSGGGVETDLDSSELDLRPGIWYHFATTRQGSLVTLYMNGLPIAQNPEMGISNLNSPSSLKIGHRGDPDDTPGSTDERGFYLNGRIDEVEIFVGTALSEEQVRMLYAAGSAGKCKRGYQPPPPLDLRVNYGHDWVESFYEAGHIVMIAVTDSDGNMKATATVITEPKDFWGGETGFQTGPDDWDPAPPDIQPYDWVFGWVDTGASAQAQIGDIQGEVFVTNDSIAGTVYVPWLEEPVQVECLDWGSGGDPFNKDAGFILPNGSDPYACSWDPETEWDVQPWQDIGVGYFTPEGHWVANAFHAEHWMTMWTADLEPGFWNEGDYSYSFQWDYTVPESYDGTTGPLAMTVTSDAVTYPGFLLIQTWPDAPQMAWTGTSCEVVPAVHPDQPTRFVWGWVNDYSMTYDEALAHFMSFTVEASWGGATSGSAPLTMGDLLPFTGREDRWEYRCSLTEHE